MEGNAADVAVVVARQAVMTEVSRGARAWLQGGRDGGGEGGGRAGECSSHEGRRGEIPRREEGAPSEGWALACAPSHAEARSASGDPSSSLAHARTVRRPLLATPWQGGHAKHGQSSCAC